MYFSLINHLVTFLIVTANSRSWILLVLNSTVNGLVSDVTGTVQSVYSQIKPVLAEVDSIDEEVVDGTIKPLLNKVVSEVNGLVSKLENLTGQITVGKRDLNRRDVEQDVTALFQCAPS